MKDCKTCEKLKGPYYQGASTIQQYICPDDMCYNEHMKAATKNNKTEQEVK